jgi:hypothetical protein
MLADHATANHAVLKATLLRKRRTLVSDSNDALLFALVQSFAAIAAGPELIRVHNFDNRVA